MDQASAEYEIWDVRYEEEEKEPTNKPESQLTERKFLSRVWGQSEAEDCHGGDEKTRHDQIIEIIHRPPSDLDGEGDVQVGLGTTLIDHLISLGRDTYYSVELQWEVWGFQPTYHFPFPVLNEGADIPAVLRV